MRDFWEETLRPILTLAALAAFGLGTVQPSAASGSTADAAARYRITLAGLAIGSAALRASTDGAVYAVEAEGEFRVLFWGGSGAVRARGTVRDGALQPAVYRLAYEGRRRPGGAEIAFADGVAVAFASFPDPPDEVFEGRVEIAPEHLKDVLDPLSALVIPASAEADPETICRRVLPVFNGFTRFDVALGGVAASGPDGVECAAQYRPVSGHRPDSRGVRRMQEPGAFSVTLAPLGDAFWAPDRIAVGTRLGTVEIVRVD